MKKITKKYKRFHIAGLKLPDERIRRRLDVYIEMALKMAVQQYSPTIPNIIATKTFNLALALMRAEEELYEQFLED